MTYVPQSKYYKLQEQYNLEQEKTKNLELQVAQLNEELIVNNQVSCLLI